jgi:hypothetical protein
VKFRELWWLSNTVFKEISFQSIFSMRAGSGLPQRGRTNIKQLVQTARLNILLSKILTTIFVAAFAFILFVFPMSETGSVSVSRQLTVAVSVSTFLASIMFLMVFMGLQVATSFVSSKIADTLSPLPLSRQDISNIIFVCFIRIFDLPLITAIIGLVSVYLFVGGTILGGLIVFAAVIVAEIFALALTVGLARFFYAKVAGGGGRSRWKTVQRFIFMIVWILPTFGTYLVLNSAAQVAMAFASFAQSLSTTSQFITLAFPFSLGFLVSFATFPQQANIVALALSAASSVGYVALAAYCFRWVTRTVRKIGGGAIASATREVVKDTVIKPQMPWLGIIRKDLRIASRSPSHATLFFFPVLQTALLAISFSTMDITRAGNWSFSVALGALTGVSMVTLLLPPTMFSIEGLASAYTRSLPLKKKTLIFAKTVLAMTTYLSSLAVLFIVAVYLGRDFSFILTFGLIHAFSVAAACMLELKIMANKFWSEGFAMGNVYARLSMFILILLPGYVTAGIPIIAVFITFFFAEQLILPVFFAIAITEFAVMSLVAFRGRQ